MILSGSQHEHNLVVGKIGSLAVLRHKFFSLLNASDQLGNSRRQKALEILSYKSCIEKL